MPGFVLRECIQNDCCAHFCMELERMVHNLITLSAVFLVLIPPKRAEALKLGNNNKRIKSKSFETFCFVMTKVTYYYKQGVMAIRYFYL